MSESRWMSTVNICQKQIYGNVKQSISLKPGKRFMNADSVKLYTDHFLQSPFKK